MSTIHVIPRRSPRLAERERHTAAKAADVARKASRVSAGPPNTFVSVAPGVPTPTAPVPTPASLPVHSFVPPRPTQHDKMSVCQHFKLLLDLTDCLAGSRRIAAMNELFEYAMITAPLFLIPNKTFRNIMRDKIHELTGQLNVLKWDNTETIRRTMKNTLDLIALIEGIP